ncbi:MAG: hypothetical protein IT529_16780 [Burkholderiales bacterium]|nr:hypothetical protein [Burkholderiales bacterium]
MKIANLIAAAAALLLVAPSFAQGKPPANRADGSMQVLREQLMKDKKQVVSANLDLTQAEAKTFWPLYEEYQKELHRVNDRIAVLLVAYAKEHNAGSLTDAKAIKLIEAALAVDEDEAKLRRAFLPRLAKVLPGRKAARYLQIENKVRAIVRYELAAEVPLAR